MQLALTKKLADALKLTPPPANEEVNPLFTWTANWINTWSNRKTEDLLVLVNNANRFAVIVYQVKRKDLKKMNTIIEEAIRNTFLEMNFHPDIVEEYMNKAGEIEYVKNSNRSATSWVNQTGQEGAIHISHTYNGIDKMYNDTLGRLMNDRPVNFSKRMSEGYYPNIKMVEHLTELTGKSVYNYRAFELLVTLDLDIYKAERRIIVPENISFYHLHEVIQITFGWKNYHQYLFSVLDSEQGRPIASLVPSFLGMEYTDSANIMDDKVLSDYFPDSKDILYTYDPGDDWEHHIKLVRVIENHTEKSPYLLEASGQAPPEDVGGVGGFVYFYDIMQDSEHPEHKHLSHWSSYWTPELGEWMTKPKVIRF